MSCSAERVAGSERGLSGLQAGAGCEVDLGFHETPNRRLRSVVLLTEGQSGKNVEVL